MMLFPPGQHCTQSRSPKICFHDPITLDSSFAGFSDQEIHTENGLAEPYKFVLKGKSDSVIDLSHTVLQLKCKILDTNDKPITLDRRRSGPVLTLAGNPISSLWSRIETRINDKIINVDSARNIPHKGIIEDYITHSQDHRAAPQGLRQFTWTVEEQHVDKFRFPRTIYEEDNDSFYDGQEVEFVGRPPVDFLLANNYLSPRSTLALTFFRQPDYYVIRNRRNIDCKLIVTSVKLHIRRLQLAQSVLPLLPQLGQDRQEVYHSKLGIVREYQIPKGSRRWDQAVILGDGLLPKQVIIGFIGADAFMGHSDQGEIDPCYFYNKRLNHLCLRVNGRQFPKKPYRLLDPLAQDDKIGYFYTQPIDTQPMSIVDAFIESLRQSKPKTVKTKRSLKVSSLRAYYGLFDQLGLTRHHVSRTWFDWGRRLYAFNLTPDKRSIMNPNLLHSKRGPLSIDVGFENGLSETMVMVVYMLYDQVINITGPTGFPVEEQF